ncbi:nucleotidyltransferase family protein [Deinococcus planocerae]|uniref:nucleotidyltransferase family protein n=1 Tax=Deinococcus planocerae TaxID=1737569 RepID=UPI000C7F0BD9|nr:sugar phosphate nucleotidyltransferase [Deinococcus planocerae]
MHAVILAGGKGSRLRPYTTCVPKPLMPIGNRYAILEILLMQLRHQGCHSITLAVGHMAPLIRAFVGDGSRFDLAVRYVEETHPLGTVGPLLPIAQDLPENFLVMNGDVLTDLNFAALLEAHGRAGTPITVATYPRQLHSEFGVLDIHHDQIVGFREKPVFDFEVSMGVYAFTRAALAGYPAGEPLGMDRLICDLLRQGRWPGSFAFRGYWLDIGRPDDYDLANQQFDELQPRLLPQVALHVLKPAAHVAI